jgi:CRISPR system Cascade subunit CasE
MSAPAILLVQVAIDIPQAVRHLRQFLSRTALDDDSLLLKTILTEGLGGPIIRPWTVHALRGPKAIIVGYSTLGGEDLQRRRALALPSVQSALGEPLTAAMPPLRTGDKFRFAVKLVPTIRVTPGGDRRHGERDAYLVAADKAGKDAGLSRDTVYCDYLRDRLQGAELERGRLEQFQLKRFARPRAAGGHAQKAAPEATLSGSLIVGDTEAFGHHLQKGVGRHKAYGYGMLRLRPLTA